MKRSEIKIEDLKAFGEEFSEDALISEPVEIRVKYRGYIQRQNEIICQTKKIFRNQKLTYPEESRLGKSNVLIHSHSHPKGFICSL